LAEDLMYAHKNLLPVVTVRPSQVVSAVSEPIKGWVEGMTVGTVGVAAGAMSGILQTMYCSEDNINRMTPIDFVVNTTIVSAYKKSLVPANEALIFNCTNSEDNLVSTHDCVKLIMKHAYDHVPEKSLALYPNLTSTSNYYWHIFSLYFFQLLPAYFFDLCFFLSGNKTL